MPTAVERCVVVGVGASADGLDAFCRLLEAMPEDPGLAFALIPHLDPGHDGRLAERLARHSSMVVVEAQDAMRIEPNHVYVISPNTFVGLRDGALVLGAPVKPGGMRRPIDGFFRSLAEECEALAIGVVLSGTGSEGTLGLKEIKAHGGMAIAQAPDPASDEGLPRSAIPTGAVDFMLPIERMPETILRYARHPHAGENGRRHLKAKSPGEIQSILHLLRDHTNYDFRSYKQGTLGRRIHRRMGLRHVETAAEYLALLRKEPTEIHKLFKDFLISVTSFFRDPEAWAVLEQEVLRGLVERKRDDEPVRIWVPGCATGEEAYSLAMVAFDQAEAQGRTLELQLFATDLDPDAIQVAREGIYPASIAGDIPSERLQRYCTEEPGQRFRVCKALRESMSFAVQDLVGDPPLSGMDLVSCRNVMIYLESSVQQRILQMFQFALRPGGALFLGHSETLGKESGAFETISKPWRIYRKLAGDNAGRPPVPFRPGSEYPPRPSGRARPEGRSAFPGRVELARRVLLERFAPASVLVDSTFEILYCHGALEGYLDLPTGSPTGNLMAVCAEGMRSKLRVAIAQAMRSQEPVTVTFPSGMRDKRLVEVSITVDPLPRYRNSEALLLVSFTEPAERCVQPIRAKHTDFGMRGRELETEGRQRVSPDDEARTIIEQLEFELHASKAELHRTIEDLSVANEEAMAMNEELLSSNEELETSREELQSLNEELSTVNNQLEEKIGEVEHTNDDLRNLLTSTELATLFLDTDFCIRRFTPATTQLLHVIDADIGRPIADFASRFEDQDLLSDAKQVLRTLAASQKRVSIEVHEDPPGADERATSENAQTRWFIRRILPYRTGEDRIAGVVVTFTDVSELQRLMAALERRERQAEAVALLGREALGAKTLDELFGLATRLLAENLEVEFSKVLELLPSHSELLLRAGVGWHEGLVGTATVGTGLESQAGFTLQTAGPVLVDDLAKERRFRGPRLLFEHGVTGGISVVIGQPTAPWGILAAHSLQERQFSADDANFVQTMAHLLWETISLHQKEAAIADRERQLRLVTDSLPVVIAFCDRSLTYRFCNATYEAWFGLEEREVVGRSLAEVIGEEAFQRWQPSLQRVLEGEAIRFQDELPFKHGSKRHVQVECLPHRSDGDGLTGLLAMISDISELVAAEKVRARLATIVEHSSDAIVAEDLDGNITAWNTAAERMFGFSADEMVGGNAGLIMPEEKAAERTEIVERLRRGERIQGHETVRRTRDGEFLHVSLTASPIRDGQGELIGISTIARDVSGRRRRELELKESERRFQLAKAAARLGVHDYDVRLGRIRWDARIRELWGVDADDDVTYAMFLEGVHPEDRQRVSADFERALDPSGSGSFESQYRIVQKRTGRVRWIDASGVVIFEGGKAVRLVGTVLDATERRRHEEELQEADRRKDQFLATLGHELRNPLGALVHSVRRLRDGVDAVEGSHLLEGMARQAEHMRSLLNDLLDIGRITRGSVELRLCRTRATEVVERSLKVVQASLDLSEHAVEIHVEPTDLTLVCDPVRCEQILVNLICNAVIYTPAPGRMQITCGEVDGMVEIAVTDNGIGLSEIEQGRIFELFYQARQGSGGLGIGLNLVQSLVTLQGGTVHVSSPGAGEGTTMTVRLPAAEPEAEAQPGAEAENGAARSPRDPVLYAGTEPLRVLAVDDQADSLRPLAALLGRYCEVRTSLTGAEALEEARRFSPHVLLLDLGLPDMSGYELSAALRELPQVAGVPHVAMTGFGDSKTVERVEAAGFAAHLVKPIDIDELVEYLHAVSHGFVTEDSDPPLDPT